MALTQYSLQRRFFLHFLPYEKVDVENGGNVEEDGEEEEDEDDLLDATDSTPSRRFEGMNDDDVSFQRQQHQQPNPEHAAYL